MSVGTLHLKHAVIVAFMMTCCALAACANQRVGMDVVYRSNLCAHQQSGLFSIKDAGAFERIVAKDPPFISGPDTSASVNLDFESKHIIVVAMGQKPSAGYRLKIQRETATLQGSTLLLPIRYSLPGDGMQAQVITSPCVIVSLDKGQYRMVRVEDYVMPL